jgi:hypothetical protein
MLTRLRPRPPSHVTVVAYLALFIALGGSAYAVATITGADVVDESLTGDDVRGMQGNSTTPAVNGSLNTNDIAGQQANPTNGTPFVDGSLTSFDVRNNTLRTDDVLDSTLTNADIRNAPGGSDDVNADKLDGLDSTKLVRGGDFGFPGGQVSFNRAQFAYPNTSSPTILRVEGAGVVVGECDERGIRIGLFNPLNPDTSHVLTHDAGSPPAWNALATGETEWAPFHFSTASTTFQVAGGLGSDFQGTGERLTTIWASARISPPEGSQCQFQAQALSQVG